MANRHGAVFVQQQHGHGLAHDVAAADDHRFLAFHGNAAGFQHVQNALGRTGHHAGLAGEELPGVFDMKAVHVLFRNDLRQGFRLVQMPGQGKLNQNAVHAAVPVQAVDFRFQLLLGGFGRQAQGFGQDAQFLAGLALVAHIYLTGGVVPYQNHSQTHRAARRFQGVHPLFQRRHLFRS